MKKFLEGLQPTLHISHRGGAALAPENTLIAFEQAVTRWRTDVLELDVQATSDGEIVVAHDATVDRCTDGAGAVKGFTLAELQSLDAGFRFTSDGKTYPFRSKGVRIPTFREILRAFPRVRLNVELKPSASGIEKELAKLLDAEHALDRVCVGSESDDVAAKLHQALPDACHFYPRDALTSYVLSLRMGEEIMDDDRYTVLDMPLYFQGMRLVDEPFLAACAKRGKWVNVWTIDDEAEMRALVKERVGGIMTDRPDTLRKVLG